MQRRSKSPRSRRPRVRRSMARRKRPIFRPSLILSLLFLLTVVAALAHLINSDKKSEVEPTEKTHPSFSDGLRARIDDALAELGIWEDLIKSRPASYKTEEKETLRKIRVRVPHDLPLIVCNLELSRLIEDLDGKVFEAVEYPEENRVVMKVGPEDRETDLIFLEVDQSITRRRGLIAIILDDFGDEGVGLAERFCQIRQPLTLAVFPGLKPSRSIAHLAVKSGHEVMVHMPMEPRNYPEEDPGPGAIFVRQPTQKIREIIRRALESVPPAAGLNNHMGSRATEDPRIMRAVLAEVKRSGLFFIDSRTSERSVAYRLAKEMGVRCEKRSIFLDNEGDQEAVERRLFELADLAAGRGYALGIGHETESTLKALKAVLPRLEKRGFRFVRASEMVR